MRPEDEVDLHFGRRGPGVSYDEVMAEIARLVETKVQEAHAKGRPYILFIHSHSTSRGNNTTARSVVRGFMRSREATPYIDRRHCVEHPSAFLVKLKPKTQSITPTSAAAMDEALVIYGAALERLAKR